MGIKKIYSREAEHKKTYRDKLLAMGLCQYCGNEPRRPGKKSCNTCACLSRHRKSKQIAKTIVGWEKTF